MVVCGSVKMYMYGNCGRTETGQAGESWVLDSLVDKNLACMIFQLIPLCNVAFIIPFHVFNPAFRLNMYPDIWLSFLDFLFSQTIPSFTLLYSVN